MTRTLLSICFALTIASGCSAQVVDTQPEPQPRGPTLRMPNCDGHSFSEMMGDHPLCPAETYGLRSDVCAFDSSFLLVDLDSPDALYVFDCDDRSDGVSRWYGHEITGAVAP